MAKRASNRERVQRMALEAELTAKDQAKKKAAKKSTTKKSTTKKSTTKKSTTKKSTTRKTTTQRATAASGERLKLVWKIFDSKSKVVAVFPYPQKDAAAAKAEQLAKKSGKEYRVNGVKVPLDEVV